MGHEIGEGRRLAGDQRLGGFGAQRWTRRRWDTVLAAKGRRNRRAQLHLWTERNARGALQRPVPRRPQRLLRDRVRPDGRAGWPLPLPRRVSARAMVLVLE